jgi:hypothetical protein
MRLRLEERLEERLERLSEPARMCVLTTSFQDIPRNSPALYLLPSFFILSPNDFLCEVIVCLSLLNIFIFSGNR